MGLYHQGDLDRPDRADQLGSERYQPVYIILPPVRCFFLCSRGELTKDA